MLDEITAAEGTLADKVAFGAQELDRLAQENDLLPLDWDTRINIDILRMSLPQSCLLGQLFGEYNEGLAALNWSDADATLRGFACSCDDFSMGPNCRGEYDELDKLWPSLIDMRRMIVERAEDKAAQAKEQASA